MNEAECKRKLVAEVKALRGGWARRVEDRFAVGILDLILKLPELPILFAEGKMIDGYKFKPTARQFVEGKRIAAAGLAVVLIGWKDGAMFVSPWVEQADMRTCFTGGDSWMTVLRNYLEGSR
jgi:hypothetical protein